MRIENQEKCSALLVARLVRVKQPHAFYGLGSQNYQVGYFAFTDGRRMDVWM